jgi:hypothetical protein
MVHVMRLCAALALLAVASANMHTGTRASDECISSLPGFCERETLVEEAVVMSDGLAYPLGPNQADLFDFTCQTRKETRRKGKGC